MLLLGAPAFSYASPQALIKETKALLGMFKPSGPREPGKREKPEVLRLRANLAAMDRSQEFLKACWFAARQAKTRSDATHLEQYRGYSNQEVSKLLDLLSAVEQSPSRTDLETSGASFETSAKNLRAEAEKYLVEVGRPEFPKE
jgi:hypothetical protein